MARSVKLALLTLLVLLAPLFGSAAAGTAPPATPTATGDEDPDAAPDFATPPGNLLPASCRFHNEAVFYTLSWGRLGQFLAADAGPCTDYYISIPPRDVDKTQPRVGEAAKIRALGLRFHAMAEFNTSAWAMWVHNPGFPDRTWADAGRLWRERIAAAGFDLADGDTWAVNEFDPSVRADASSRRDMQQLVNALATGDPGMPYTPGTVFVIGPDQRSSDVAGYKAELEGWLQDDAFWADMEEPVRFFAQETYADAVDWGVAEAPRNTRAAYLNDYFEHLARLAEADPRGETEAARFLRAAYVPLMNSAWRFDTGSGFGLTMLDIGTMESFVSEQAFANRLYAGSHPQLAPNGRIGFAYVQRNSPPALPTADFNAQTALLLQRLASAIHHSYEEGGSSPVGACGTPGDFVWCDGSMAGAAFNDAWQSFASWN
jgi:hypothetical protein